MSFLQPWLLACLPLVALPIIIHLINQRRFQTINWGAMMFLLAAHRMARGYSRLRQLLIMLFRMLAIAALVLAVSRPLASGWLGLTAGGKADTTIILLDRSPSMQQRDAGAASSKLETGRQQLVSALETLGSSHWVLIESTSAEPRELESPGAILDLPGAGPASAAADLPKMLQAAHDYIRDHRAGRTEIWLCSDLRQNDWAAESGRWATLRDAFLEFPQEVRFQLLAYPQAAAANLSVRVTEVRRQPTSEGAELVISLRLSRQGNSEEKLSVPVQFEIEGARSVVTAELNGSHTDLKDHRIPIDGKRERGWGRVSLPADENPADDEFYFAFDMPSPRRTMIVVDDPLVGRPLELAAGISSDPAQESAAEMVSLEQLPVLEWDQFSLVLWQAPLPTGDVAELLKTFVDRGGQAVFLPPENPGTAELFGLSWQEWVRSDEPAPIEAWRGDEDLLSRTLSGAALPVGQLEVRQYCSLKGECTALATLRGGAPLLVRVPSKLGGIYFWTTTSSPRDSSLAAGGVVLYAFVQRALAAGSAALGKTRQLDAGEPGGTSPTDWKRVTETEQGLSSEAAFQAGVYGAEDRLFAVNRPLAEDATSVLPDDRVAGRSK